MPTNRKEALLWLENFFENKFLNFGNYEDAIRSDNNFLFHSAISPVLNMGLLTPDEVVKKTLEFAELNSIPINSLEGFIRQIIGWREFIRGIYHHKGNEETNSNFWNHHGKLTSHWYEGTTGIAPLDDAIKDCIKYGYTHHIPRLMVICNIMNLSKIHPNEIYKWFMEMFVDSSDWVMVPNVFGMGTFADGGIFATKPYSCGSNYILKMSNYKKDEWCDIVDGLYWMFMNDNVSFFKSNPRLAILVKSLERMKNERKELIFGKAIDFINSKTIK
jgi:deoxyribodipyrimidine photolyase-related protein